MNASDHGLITRGIEWARTCQYQPVGALLHPLGVTGTLSNGMQVGLAIFPLAITLATPRDIEQEPIRKVADEECEWLEGVLGDLHVTISGRWDRARGRGWALGIETTVAVRALVRAYWAGCPEHMGNLLCTCGWSERGRALVILPTGWRPASDQGLGAA